VTATVFNAQNVTVTWDSLRRTIDFLHVDTVMLKRLYAAVLIEVGSRRTYLLGVTDHPTSAWAAQVAREVAADLEQAGRFFTRLIRDRDAKFTDAFDGCSPPSASRSCSPRHRRQG